MAVFRSCNLIAHKCREAISLSTPSERVAGTCKADVQPMDTRSALERLVGWDSVHCVHDGFAGIRGTERGHVSAQFFHPGLTHHGIVAPSTHVAINPG